MSTSGFSGANSSTDRYYLIETSTFPLVVNAPVNSDMLDYRSGRNFEQLICERGDDSMLVESMHENNPFNEIFEKIREKLFVIGDCDVDISHDDKKRYTEKYNTIETNKVLNELKKNIVLLHNKKIELEIEIENKTKLYNTFCKNIQDLVNHIILANEPCDEDIQLKDLLFKRIEWYYDSLKLEQLITDQFDVVGEYSFLKQTLRNLNGTLISTVCTICLEKQVNWFIDPCGHCVCDDCKVKTEQTSTCHYCRHKKTKYNKLYL
jgi:hypothetical protein